MAFCRTPCEPAVANAATGRDSQGARATFWILAATILGSSLSFLDGTVVTVVLPIIQQELHATIVGAQWIVEIYLLFLSSLILVGGAVGDRLGRERVFTGGVLAFGISSIGCAFSPSLGVLVVWRALQGIASAFLIPESLAILGAAFTPGERGRAVGTWSAASSIVMAGGPILGGWLAQHTSWRWIFALNVPLAAAVVAIMWFEVPFSVPHKATRALDWIGATLITAGLGGIVFGLIESPQYGLGSLRVVLSLIIGVALIGAFIVVEDRVIRPLVPLMLFRSRAFSGANLITLLLYAGLGGAIFFLPFHLIQVHHYSAAAAGASMLPLVILMGLLSRFSGELSERIGITLPLTIGPLLCAIGIATFALPGAGGSYWVTFFPGMVILGLGLATTVAPLTTAVLSAVDDEFEGVASGVNNAVARLGNLLAIGVLGIIVAQRFSTQLDTALAHAGASAQVRQTLSAQALQLSAIKPPPGLEHGVAAAAVSAFRAAMIVSAMLALVAAGVGATTLPPRRGRRR
ncbi:MAG TPA: DHA2 family efflux MFS transporter permease subunit [Gemmatimonadaceae bacterium]|nr:DHA2 family efflux MFS transporter permease subunit [Gemmatimonadaceae bacterium]